MRYTPNYEWNWFLRRGRTWQTDCYPSPGAAVNKYNKKGVMVSPKISTMNLSGWPFDNYQETTPP